jgi:hypothetical protein
MKIPDGMRYNRFAYEDFIRIRHITQPGCDVDRLAQRTVGRFRRNGSIIEDFSGIDARMHHQSPDTSQPSKSVHTLNSFVNSDSSPYSPDRIIFTGLMQAEHCHHGITDIFLYNSTMCSDDSGGFRQDPIRKGFEILRIKPFRERTESA